MPENGDNKRHTDTLIREMHGKMGKVESYVETNTEAIKAISKTVAVHDRDISKIKGVFSVVVVVIGAAWTGLLAYVGLKK